MSSSRWLVVAAVLVMAAGCGDDDGDTNDNSNVSVCDGVDCGPHGSCVDDEGQAACDCDTGYHAEGLTCVEDAGNAAPTITSTPAEDATELVLYEYEVTCTDADGDSLTLDVGAADTCGGVMADNGDGTGTYRFTSMPVTADEQCTLEISCDDGADQDSQTATITIHDVPEECVEDVTFVGQVDGSADPTSTHGGTLTTTPWDTSYDAGIAAVIAATPATPGDATTVSLAVSQATIIATYVGPQSYHRLWLADGNGAIKVFLTTDAPQNPTFVPKVGSRVSVDVAEVTNYAGQPEITAVEDSSWTLDSTDNEVVVTDHTGGPELTAADVNELVRVTGTLSSAGVACGGSYLCYDFDYGVSTTAQFRTDIAGLALGDCITWLGPLHIFNATPQLTIYNPDWYTLH